MPDETRKFPLAEATLYLGEHLNDDGTAFPADRMVVQHVTGNQDDVLIFKRGGKHRVGRVKLSMDIGSTTPAVPASVTFEHSVEEIPSDDEKNLLAIYDEFDKRTQK